MRLLSRASRGGLVKLSTLRLQNSSKTSPEQQRERQREREREREREKTAPLAEAVESRLRRRGLLAAVTRKPWRAPPDQLIRSMTRTVRGPLYIFSSSVNGLATIVVVL